MRERDGRKFIPLITELQTLSTNTQTQFDVISSWFTLPAYVDNDEEGFNLSDAIEIAAEVTKSVYRVFNATIVQNNLSKIDLVFSNQCLVLFTDCLFVIFENTWKHSGLGDLLEEINIYATFDEAKNLIT